MPDHALTVSSPPPPPILALSPWPAASPFTPYGRFLAWLREHQDEIIDEWVVRLGQLSQAYRRRPTSELYVTVTGAFRANAQALENGDLIRIEQFIDFITQKAAAGRLPPVGRAKGL